jgi:hypothetical protein
MGNAESHNYLYNNILKPVDQNYIYVDFDWGSSVAKPGDL